MVLARSGLALVVVLASACGGGASSGEDAAAGSDGGGVDAGGADASEADAPAACEPTAPATEACDGVDNDCNGRVDDVDVGGDGVSDCLRVGLFGGGAQVATAGLGVWMATLGPGVTRTQDAGSEGELTAAVLGAYDVIVLESMVRVYTAAEANALRDWVAAGGGLVVMSGYSPIVADLDRPNSLLGPIGLVLEPGLISGPVTTFSAHPLTTGLTSIEFRGGYPVGVIAGIVGGTNEAVATIGASRIAIAQQRGRGRVFVWGDEWISYDAQISAEPQVRAFWVSILGWLRP